MQTVLENSRAGDELINESSYSTLRPRSLSKACSRSLLPKRSKLEHFLTQVPSFQALLMYKIQAI